MDKLETALLLKEINHFFPGKLKAENRTIESWQRVLAGEAYEVVLNRLDKYVLHSKLLPTVYDLVEKPRPEHDKNVLRQVEEWEEVASGAPRKC